MRRAIYEKCLDLEGENYMNYMSEAGKHHSYDNAQNQDYVLYEKNNNTSYIILADGVSSGKYSADGARIACDITKEFLKATGETIFDRNSYEIAGSLLSDINVALKCEAEKRKADIDEYASTIAFAVIDYNRNEIYYFSLGDSLIIVSGNESFTVLSMPSDSREGCCVTTTLNGYMHSNSGVISTDDINSVVICSDGAWHLMYNRNKIDPAVREVLIKQDYNSLFKLLTDKERVDDCSIISMDLVGSSFKS